MSTDSSRNSLKRSTGLLNLSLNEQGSQPENVTGGLHCGQGKRLAPKRTYSISPSISTHSSNKLFKFSSSQFRRVKSDAYANNSIENDVRNWSPFKDVRSDDDNDSSRSSNSIFSTIRKVPEGGEPESFLSAYDVDAPIKTTGFFGAGHRKQASGSTIKLVGGAKTGPKESEFKFTFNGGGANTEVLRKNSTSDKKPDFFTKIRQSGNEHTPLFSFKNLGANSTTRNVNNRSSNARQNKPISHSYKFVKPLQTAFASSGLMSKKSSAVSNTPLNQDGYASLAGVPDTPCKSVSYSSFKPMTVEKPRSRLSSYVSMCHDDDVFGSKGLFSSAKKSDLEMMLIDSPNFDKKSLELDFSPHGGAVLPNFNLRKSARFLRFDSDHMAYDESPSAQRIVAAHDVAGSPSSIDKTPSKSASSKRLKDKLKSVSSGQNVAPLSDTPFNMMKKGFADSNSLFSISANASDDSINNCRSRTGRRKQAGSGTATATATDSTLLVRSPSLKLLNSLKEPGSFALSTAAVLQADLGQRGKKGVKNLFGKPTDGASGKPAGYPSGYGLQYECEQGRNSMALDDLDGYDDMYHMTPTKRSFLKNRGALLSPNDDTLVNDDTLKGCMLNKGSHGVLQDRVDQPSAGSLRFTLGSVSKPGTGTGAGTKGARTPNSSSISLDKAVTPTGRAADYEDKPIFDPLDVEGGFYELLLRPTITDEYLCSKLGSNIKLTGEGEFSLVFECDFKNSKYAIKRSKKQVRVKRNHSYSHQDNRDASYTFSNTTDQELIRTLVGGNMDRVNYNPDEEIEILNLLKKNARKFTGSEYLVTYVSNFTVNNYNYIVTEFCENGSLDRFLLKHAEQRLDEFRVWKIVTEILFGLNFLHENGILHLDLKPANIFINFEGSLKIGDFGLSAKVCEVSNKCESQGRRDLKIFSGHGTGATEELGNSSSTMPQVVEKEGDREYIAPEILLQSSYSPAADIFSLGLITVEIAANIYLPDNGVSWQKLRSGDLSDAGRLSFRDLRINNMTSESASTASTSTNNQSLLTKNYSNLTSDTSASVSHYINPGSSRMETSSSISNEDENTIDSKAHNTFLHDGQTLDTMVHWMIEPNPKNRPSASELISLYELQYIELKRKAGAIIYEGEYGPPLNMDDPVEIDEEEDFAFNHNDSYEYIAERGTAQAHNSNTTLDGKPQENPHTIKEYLEGFPSVKTLYHMNKFSNSSSSNDLTYENINAYNHC